MQQTADRALALFIALILALALAFYSYKANAQSWVDRLQNKQGAICCTNNDGRRLDDPDWDTLGKVTDDHNGPSGFRVYEDGKWHDVPNWAIVMQSNIDGIPRVWWDRELIGSDIVKKVRCFIVGITG